MKKKNLLTLLSLVTLGIGLTGCSGSQNETKLPNKGTVITNDEGKKQLSNSTRKMASELLESSNDAIGVSVNGAHVEAEIDIDQKMNGVSAYSMNYSFKAKDGYLNAGFKGLTAEKASDISAFLTSGIKIDGDVKVSAQNYDGGTSTVTSEIDGDYAVGAYLENNQVFFDFSNEDVKSLITVFGSSVGIESTTLPANGKFKTDVAVDEATLPLLEEEDLNTIDSEISELLGEIELPENGEFRDHGNGKYSYSGSYDVADIEDQLKKADYDVSLSFDKKTEISYAIIFDESGFVSFGFEGNVKMEFVSEESLDFGNDNELYLDSGIEVGDGFSYTMTGTMDYSFGYKVNFLKGDKVKFPTINENEYTNIELA